MILAENLLNKEKLKARIIQAYGSTEEDWEKSKMKKIVKDCTLKDVIEFETVVKVAVTPKGQEMYLMISLSPDKIRDLKYGDTVDVFLVKQKKKEEEPDERKT